MSGSGRITPGTIVPTRSLRTITGAEIAFPDPNRLIHLQFRRFAGCPVCNLHLRSIVRRHAEIEAAGISEIVFFHSSEEELLVHADSLPFAVVADPAKRFYREFGVEAGARALLNPRAWLPILRAVALSLWAIIRRRGAAPSTDPEGGRYGLPADFLIGRDGRVLASKYGEHVYDQWSVEELFALAPASGN